MRAPELLLLDEPTVGVDPLSRRELWEIILSLVQVQGLTVLLSTAYLDEAERCQHVVVLHEGKVLAQGAPAHVTGLAAGRTFLAQPRAGQPARGLQARLLDDPGVVDAVPEGGRVRFVQAPHAQSNGRLPEAGPLAGIAIAPVQARFEDGFMVLLRQTTAQRHMAGPLTLDRPLERHGGEVVVQVRDLVRRFDFHCCRPRRLRVCRGEIFGLLGPNGAAKPPRFACSADCRPPLARCAWPTWICVRRGPQPAADRVRGPEVLALWSAVGDRKPRIFASAYGLRGARKRDRIDWALQQFALTPLARLPSGQLPGGYKQRLAMAAALLHEPEMLFLDEPTSGADPLARREFWRRITTLAEQGVTVIITTHFMEEAEYCDRVVILDAGRVLAQGMPAEIRSRAQPAPGQAPTMEDAFVAIVEEARAGESHQGATTGGAV